MREMDRGMRSADIARSPLSVSPGRPALAIVRVIIRISQTAIDPIVSNQRSRSSIVVRNRRSISIPKR